MVGSAWAASILDVSGFGVFAMASAVAIISYGVVRTSVVDVAIVSTAGDVDQLNEVGRALLRRAFAVGLVLGLGVALVWAVVSFASRPDPSLGLLVYAVALSVPVLGLHDAVRSLAIGIRRPGVAIVSDLVWGVFVLALYGVALLTDWPGEEVKPVVAYLGWAAGALLSLGALLLLRGLGHARFASGTKGRLAWELSFSYLLQNGAGLAARLPLGVVGGPAAAAVVRMLQLVLGPVPVVLNGVRSLGLAGVARAVAHDPSRTRRRLGHLRVAIVGLSVTILLLVSLVPESLMTRMLGPTWLAASPFLWLVIIPVLAQAWELPRAMMLRALGQGRRLLRARAVAAPVVLLGPAVGYLVAALPGAIVGSAVGFLVSGLLSFPETDAPPASSRR